MSDTTSVTASDLADVYAGRTPGSRRLMARASTVMPGGNTRSATHFDPYPTVLRSGTRCHVVDVDGNEYLDAFFSGTSLVHGHAHPGTMAAIAAASTSGIGWFAPSPTQIEFAETLCDRIASVDQVRLCSSGTEASLLAIRLAQRHTGRRGILKAVGGYHGFTAELDVDPVANREAGVHLARFGDAASFERVLQEHGSTIAVVLLEPVIGVGGVLTGAVDFFERVQRAAAAAGSVLVLDEVISLRLAVGGAQALLGVRPDLTVMGKSIGGGAPIGAVGGRADLLAALDPRTAEPLRHAGTFNGNPLSCAAGLVSLRELDAAAIDRMAAVAATIGDGLEGVAAAAGLPFSVRRAGSLVGLFFMDRPPEEPMVGRPDADLLGRFHLACMNHGFALGSRGIIAVPSVADDRYVDELLTRASEAFGDVARDRA